MQVQYIGTQDTKVRVGGVKIDVAPGEVFEMEEVEGLLLINWPYRNFYIQEGADLTEKQNPDNNKFPPQTIIGKEIEALKQPQEEEKTNIIPEVAHILARIHTAQTIDVLNEVSTDVANEDALSENEEIVKAIEDKMAEFLKETDETDVKPQENKPQEEEKTAEDTKPTQTPKNTKKGAKNGKRAV